MTTPTDMSSRLVSVVIPAHNAEAFIERTLRSALGQTHGALEVLVVDDGSTDRTAELAIAVAGADPRFRLIAKENGGVASARNLGLAEARGAFVAFLDADDLWHPDKIAKQLAAIPVDDPEWLGSYTLHRVIDDQDQVIGDGKSAAVSGFILCRHLVMRLVGNGSSLLVRREAALAVGGFDPSWAQRGLGGTEDLDFELKIAARGRLAAVPEYLVGYRVHEGSMSSDRVRMGRACVATIRRHIEAHPALSPRTRRWAMAMAHRFALVMALQDGALGPAMGSLGAMLSYDPLLGAADVVASLFMRLSGYPAGSLGLRAPRPFQQMPPTQPGNRRSPPTQRWRLSQLAAEDAALEPLYLAGRADPEARAP